jgi:hypothetical protein
LKVICIGDSITQGKVVNDTISELSYRFWLWEKLDSVGFKVDMLGSNNIWFQENRNNRVDTPVSRYTGHVFDMDHESYYGIKTGETLLGGFTHDSVKYDSFLNRLLKLDIPDVAFIHIGTNDSKGDSAQTIGYIKQIIEELHGRNPKIIIFLAKLSTPWCRFVNHSVEPVIKEFSKKYPQMLIVTVDMASGWVNCPDLANACTNDWAHPNKHGQQLMAEKWFKAFMSVGDRKMPEFNAQARVSGITDSTAVISWNNASDNKYVAGYNVYVNYTQVNWRYSECGNFDKQCIALVPQNSYKLIGLEKGKEYTIAVTAVDYANNVATSKEIKIKL